MRNFLRLLAALSLMATALLGLNFQPTAKAHADVWNQATFMRCDQTGGHCARLKLALEEKNGLVRGQGSVTCLAANHYQTCRSIQGGIWLSINDQEYQASFSCSGNCPAGPFQVSTGWVRAPEGPANYFVGSAWYVRTPTGSTGVSGSVGVSGGQ